MLCAECKIQITRADRWTSKSNDYFIDCFRDINMAENIIIKSQDNAIKDLENIFLQAGFALDWQFDENSNNKPVAYNTTIPNDAWSKILSKPQSSPNQAKLLLLYKQAQSTFVRADNKFGAVSQAFNLTLYYDNKDIWIIDEKNEFSKYLVDLFNSLQDGGWDIQDFGENVEQAIDSKDTWMYSRGYRIQKMFF